MNIELAQKIIDHILEEPRRVDMGMWLDTSAGHLSPPCGTVGCIAGWAVMLSPDPKRRLQQDWTWSDEAKRRLGITEAQAEALFFDESWPDEFCDRLTPLIARTTEYAQVVADRLRYMMEHGE